MNLATDPSHAATLRQMRALCDAEMNARGGALLPLDQRGAKNLLCKKAAQKSNPTAK